MRTHLVPNATLELHPGRALASRGPGSTLEPFELGAHDVLLLESFVHSSSVEQARTDVTKWAHDTRSRRSQVHHRSWRAIVTTERLVGVFDGVRRDLTEQSRTAGPLMVGPVDTWSESQADESLGRLVSMGLLVPPVGQIDWGDLGSSTPFCARFGFGRGEPIDRHYEARMCSSIRPRVAGRVLELGRDPRGRLRSWDATEHLVIDLDEKPGVDVAANAEQTDLFESEAFDTVLAFNFLEHVDDAGRIVGNVHAWLRPEGRFFGLVPSSQRIHRLPIDSARLLPDGLRSLLSAFRSVEVWVYGNLLTAVAALAGACVDDLPPDMIDVVQADFPVCCGFEAVK